MAWYVIYTRSRSEKTVNQDLIDKGYLTYLPLVKTMKQWSDRKKKVEIPLIPGYVFVNTDQTHFTKILQQSGVVNFVIFNKAPAKVRNVDIENIKILLNETEHVSVINKQFTQGEEVYIADGKFKGFRGIIDYQRGKNNLVVSLLELGMSVKVEIPVEHINQLKK